MNNNGTVINSKTPQLNQHLQITQTVSPDATFLIVWPPTRNNFRRYLSPVQVKNVFIQITLIYRIAPSH